MASGAVQAGHVGLRSLVSICKQGICTNYVTKVCLICVNTQRLCDG